MLTLFVLIADGDAPLDLDLSLFQQSLPKNIRVESRADGTYVSVDSKDPEDSTAQYCIDRELDRVYFLTCVRVRAVMCRKRVTASQSIRYSIHGTLPVTIAPQVWSYNLGLQLRLWAIASELDDPLAKLLLLFQIIELSYPLRSDYPQYIDSAIPPHPRTESKLLRHVVTHSGEVTGTELKNYCEHLGLPHLMLDRTDQQHMDIFAKRVAIVENEGKAVLASAL